MRYNVIKNKHYTRKERTLKMSTLKIALADGAKDALAGYPFRAGEHIEAEYEDGDGYQVVEVNMADHDTTAAQEQFLNASSDVINYGVDDPNPESDI